MQGRSEQDLQTKHWNAKGTIDEVGNLPVTSQEAFLFFQFISYCYEKNSTIITSKKSLSDWQDFFGDPFIAAAILDRLITHSKQPRNQYLAPVRLLGHLFYLKAPNFLFCHLSPLHHAMCRLRDNEPQIPNKFKAI
jgi:hypothetical protein